jgi:hypothetical protein
MRSALDEVFGWIMPPMSGTGQKITVLISAKFGRFAKCRRLWLAGALFYHSCYGR